MSLLNNVATTVFILFQDELRQQQEEEMDDYCSQVRQNFSEDIGVKFLEYVRNMYGNWPKRNCCLMDEYFLYQKYVFLLMTRSLYILTHFYVRT